MEGRRPETAKDPHLQRPQIPGARRNYPDEEEGHRTYRPTAYIFQEDIQAIDKKAWVTYIPALAGSHLETL